MTPMLVTNEIAPFLALLLSLALVYAIVCNRISSMEPHAGVEADARMVNALAPPPPKKSALGYKTTVISLSVFAAASAVSSSSLSSAAVSAAAVDRNG
ncbi:MAG: hypothetical protein Q9196_002342 [Gyalolechia fulgens]